MIRAKELFTWEPSFLPLKEDDYVSDEEAVRANSYHNASHPPGDADCGDADCGDAVCGDADCGDEDISSDDEEIPETIFGSKLSSSKRVNEDIGEVHSEDPFGVYDMLEKSKKVADHTASPSLSHPPGFTPVVSDHNTFNDNANEGSERNVEHSPAIEAVNTESVFSSGEAADQSCEQVGAQSVKSGGSVLDIMEGLIKVGKSMGYTMDGCIQDLEKIIGQQGDSIVFR